MRELVSERDFLEVRMSVHVRERVCKCVRMHERLRELMRVRKFVHVREHVRQRV